MPAAPDTTHPVQASLYVSVNDPSGHAAHATATVPVRSAEPLIGIKPGFDGSVDAGSEAAFDIAAIDPDNTPCGVAGAGAAGARAARIGGW